MNASASDMAFDGQPRGDRYKWWLLAFLFVTYFLEQGARQVYNATHLQIKADFIEVQSHSCCRHSLVFNECA